jgi:hypothetical protein
MPRRRPDQLRVDLRVQLLASQDRRGRRFSQLPGLSRRGQYQLARLEAIRLSPGQVQDYLRRWRRFVRDDPYHRRWDPRYEGCGYTECCPDFYEIRAVLEIVPHHLPPCDARRFRALLADIDRDW